MLESEIAILTDLKDSLAKLGEVIAAQLKDTSIPLDERWQAFMSLPPDTLPTQGYGKGFVHLLDDNLTLYDDFYIERHETTAYADMFERIEDGEVEVADEALAKWKEQVLASGYQAFTHDW